MNVLQKKMLDMLCEIDQICRQHEIEYCLFAGSGLGAERHGGFIPWDDDADIIMTLNNYEKFLKVFDAEAKEGRVLNCLEKSIDYPFTYARYVDVTTTAIQRHTAFGGCDPGVKIDIFIAVPTHSKLDKAEKHRLEILAFSEVICPYATMHYQRPEGYLPVYLAEKKLYDKLGREKYIKKRKPQLMNYKKKGTGRYVLFSGMMCNSYLLDEEILDEIRYVKFEDTKLPVSKNNIRFCKELYGEGWISKPPAVEVPRHTYLLDLNKPYGEYIEKLWKRYDFDAAERTAANRKAMHVFERDQFKDVLVNNQKLKNLAVELGMNNRFKALTNEEQQNWQYLYGMFDEYYITQLKSNNRNYNLFINLSLKTFEAAMNAAVMMDRYYEAADIISIGMRADALPENDETIKKLLYRIDVCRKITEILYIEKDLKKLKAIIEEISDETVKGSLTVIIAKLWIEAVTKDKEGLDKVCEEVDSFLEVYGNMGELLAIKGYCLEKKGWKEKAESIYAMSAENTCNGFVYQWLRDRGYSTYEYKYE